MMRLLIADDDPAIRRLLRTQLAAGGYEVVVASDGEEAWAALRHGDIPLTVLDWNMPGVDGVEICRRLRAAKLPVYALVLTGEHDADKVASVLTAGASDYVTKPWVPDVLLARVHVGARIVGMQTQVLHAQKLEAIGRLAAGIAHEINTPIQYMTDNLRFISEAMDSLVALVTAYGEWAEAATESEKRSGEASRLMELAEAADVSFLAEELPIAVAQSLDGADHVSRIIRAMTDFSHPGDKGKQSVDLNQAIKSTVTIARNTWKQVAEMVLQLDPTLPDVQCFASEINQALLHIIANAVEAIAEAAEKDPASKRGRISITTRHDGAWVEICIADTGVGICEESQSKVFDHFYTTKPIGQGTGQGLAIAHAVIVDKHGGVIAFESEVDRGTTFVIRLPIDDEKAGSVKGATFAESCAMS